MRTHNETGYAFALNKTLHSSDRYITQKELREKFNIGEDLAIFMKREGIDVEITGDEPIDLAPDEIEDFYTLSRHPVHTISINKKDFDWKGDSISEEQIRALGNIPAGERIYYSIQGDDELVVTGKPIDVGRRGKEEFYSLPDKPDGHVVLTIETTKGKWIKHAFPETLTVAELIKLVVAKYQFAADGNYEIRIKAGEPLDPAHKLESYQLKDCTVLTFTDLGKGA